MAGIHFEPIGAGVPGSSVSNAGDTCSISFEMALVHRFVLVSLIISQAYLILFGVSILFFDDA
jgi:hypothetical protein